MRLRRGCRGWWIALLAAAADRVTKAAATRTGANGPLIPGVLDLRLTTNSGMAFSMLSGQGLALTLLTLALAAALTGWLVSHPDAPGLFRAGLWLIAGGGLGNLYDRVASGAVCDFIDLAFVRFAVFNVADVCICLGAALVVAGVWASEKKSGKAKDKS